MTDGGAKPGVVNRLRSGILAFLERNERERLLQPRGWHHHVREVYALYFEQRRIAGPDARRQRWQKQRKDA